MYQDAASDSVAEWLVNLYLSVHCTCVFPFFVFAQDAVVVRGIALGLPEIPTKKRRVILTPIPTYAEMWSAGGLSAHSRYVVSSCSGCVVMGLIDR